MSKTIKINFKLQLDGQEQLVTATASARDLAKAVGGVGTNLSRATGSFIGFNQRIEALRNVTGAFQELAAGIEGLTQGAEAFNTAMRQANTLAEKNEAGFAGMRDEVDRLAKELPVSREELARGLYTVISADVPEAEWMEVLETAARSSVGALADLGEIVSVTGTLVKNYGLSWKEAGDIQDKIQLTAKVGETTFSEMAAALPRVSASAATLGVSIDELMGVFASLTGVSGDTAEVSTQLAAVLNALVKPAGEATAMAERMGIQFDAASVKAAGGFSAFIKQLDGEVTAFAAKSGMLRESIYGTLFGRAEALRALIPLTGELAEKYERDTASMASASGTLAGAFDEMSKTVASKAQLAQNNIDAMFDGVAEATGGAVVYVKAFGGTLSAVATTVVMTGTAAKMLAGAIASTTLATKAAALAATLWKNLQRALQVATLSFSASCYAAGTAVTVLKFAIRGLLVATGVGAAIAALTMVIEALLKACDSDPADGLAQSLGGVRTAAQEASAAFDETLARELGRLQADFAKLREGWKACRTEGERRAWLEKNRDLLTELRLGISSATDAERVFSGDTSAFTSALKKRAEAMANYAALTKLYEKRIELQNNITRARKPFTAAKGAEVSALPPDIRKMLGRGDTEKRFEGYTGAGPGMWVPNYSERLTEQGAARVNAARKVLEGPWIKEQRAQLAELEKLEQKYAAGAAEAAPARGIGGRPVRADRGKEQGRASRATAEKAVTPLSLVEEPVTEADFENNARYWEAAARAAAVGSEAWNKAHENAEACRAAIRWAAKETEQSYIPAQLDEIRTLGGIEEALSYYRTRLQEASGDELQTVQGSIDALEKKRDTMEALARLPEARREADEALAAPANSRMGAEAATAKLAELRKLLDTDGLTDSQRGQILELIGTYESLRRSAVLSFSTLREGWSAVQGVASGIQGLSDALEGNGNAWEKFSAIVSGAISVFQGVTAAIAIFKQVSSVMGTAGASAATAQTAAATASAVDTVAMEAQTVAAVPLAAANKTLAASLMQVAAAQYMAAHAYIPFAGFGIGAGFAASAKALVASMAIPFAKGGLVSGPTYALVGEYPGAGRNPEVIAPLDKLRSMLRPYRDEAGSVDWRIKGRTLYGVLNRENRVRARS